MFAKIYKPSPSAMSSGRANSNHWVIEFEGAAPRGIDPLTGNTISRDMQTQVELTFETLDEAISFVKAKRIPHRVIPEKRTQRIPRSYSENFAYDRKLPWTH